MNKHSCGICNLHGPCRTEQSMISWQGIKVTAVADDTVCLDAVRGCSGAARRRRRRPRCVGGGALRTAGATRPVRRRSAAAQLLGEAVPAAARSSDLVACLQAVAQSCRQHQCRGTQRPPKVAVRLATQALDASAKQPAGAELTRGRVWLRRVAAGGRARLASHSPTARVVMAQASANDTQYCIVLTAMVL